MSRWISSIRSAATSYVMSGVGIVFVFEIYCIMSYPIPYLSVANALLEEVEETGELPEVDNHEDHDDAALSGRKEAVSRSQISVCACAYFE